MILSVITANDHVLRLTWYDKAWQAGDGSFLINQLSYILDDEITKSIESDPIDFQSLGLASRTDTFNKGQYVQGVSDDQKEKAV